MNPTMINAIATERNQDLRDHAAAVRLAREARRAQRAQARAQAHTQSYAQSHAQPSRRAAEPAISPCPAVAAR